MPDTKELERVRFTSEDIGVMLLESISQGLYHNPMNSVREYVQNEYDAAASEVRIVASSDRITITGDGRGMTEEDLLTAKRIGFSRKDPRANVGFRGIGIWSGVAICDEILIGSKSSDDPVGHVLKIDAHGLRADMRNAEMPLTESLSNRVYKRTLTRDEFRAKHGTRVELRAILPQHATILDRQSLLSFAEQILPVEINPEYQFAPLVTQRLRELVQDYRTIRIFVNDTQAFRPPTGATNTLKPVFDTVTSTDQALLAIAWYAIDEDGSVDLPSRYMVYKKKGFTVGDVSRSNLLLLTPTNRHILTWTTGEVHVIHEGIVPTAERLDFETTAPYRVLEERLKTLLSSVIDGVRRAQAGRTAEERLNYQTNLRQRFLASSDPEDRLNVFLEGRDFLKLLDQDAKNSMLAPRLKKRVLAMRTGLRRDMEFIASNFDSSEREVPVEEPSRKRPTRKPVEYKPTVTPEKVAGELGAHFPFDQMSLRLLRAVLNAADRIFGSKPASMARFVSFLSEELQRQGKR